MRNKLTLDDFMEALPAARRYDRYVAGICPFHDDAKPSLLVFDDGWFRCRGCGQVGTHDRLWHALKKMGPIVPGPERVQWKPPVMPKRKEAVDDLVWKAHQDLVNEPSRGWYLEMRGVAGRIGPCRLGWYDGWYTIPVLDNGGEIQGVILRAGPHVEHISGQRFIQPVGQKPMLYVPDWRLVDSGRAVVVVYGMFDALTLAECRVPVLTTTGGKDALSGEWLDDYRKPLVVLPDRGEEATGRKLASQLGWRGRVVTPNWPEGCKDANDVFVKHGEKALLSILSPYLGG